MKHLRLECTCTHALHSARLSYLDNDDLYLQVGLPADKSFLRRLWVGIGYVLLNRRSSYGDLGDFLFNQETTREAIAFMQGFVDLENEE